MNRADIEKIHFKNTPLVGSGSYFICGVKDTDIDYFTLDTTDTRKLLDTLDFSGYDGDIPDQYADSVKLAFGQCMGEVFSFRRGNINIILVQTIQELERIQLATDVARKLKLNNRDDRLVVFDAIRRNIGPYDNDLGEMITCEIPRL